jgi:hypothetical protein
VKRKIKYCRKTQKQIQKAQLFLFFLFVISLDIGWVKLAFLKEKEVILESKESWGPYSDALKNSLTVLNK